MYLLLYVGVIIYVCYYIRKKKNEAQGNGSANGQFGKTGQFGQSRTAESGSMAHKHRAAGHYDTYNKKRFGQESGAMPHKHEKKHYTSMADASKLPPGYILLNGEPVRVADLEGK